MKRAMCVVFVLFKDGKFLVEKRPETDTLTQARLCCREATGSLVRVSRAR
jgi:hypothetical protein